MRPAFCTLPLIASLVLAATLPAAIVVPGADGSDGALNVTVDTVIDLSQAVTGAWEASNAGNPGVGRYDAGKWAVVFKYSSVTVAAGRTLTFKNHPSRAPVVWLVSGAVNIAGTVNLDGQATQVSPLLPEPGPGGFRGAASSYTSTLRGGAGFGPGGGGQGSDTGGGGAYGGTGGTNTGSVYGNPSLIPLIGGSGGAADPENRVAGAGAGAGALLIASTTSVAITGEIRANGGAGVNGGFENGGGGSGGGIRLVCDTLQGTGKINAIGGTGWSAGGVGRIRLERVNNSNSIAVAPEPSTIPLAPNESALLWPPADAPEVKIVSIGGQNIPADPRASFGTFAPDAAIPQTTSTSVVLETRNVEQLSTLKVRVTPRFNGSFTEVNASVSSVVSTTPLVIRWSATIPVVTGGSAVQARVIRP